MIPAFLATAVDPSVPLIAAARPAGPVLPDGERRRLAEATLTRNAHRRSGFVDTRCRACGETVPCTTRERAVETIAEILAAHQQRRAEWKKARK